MRASKVKLRELKTFNECVEMIDSIERDWRNVEGGWAAWISGGPTYLNATAEKKIDALWKRAYRISPVEEEGE